jgi:hypothetical protein
LYLIFISHAGADTWVAKRISECIEKNGADTFLDEAQIAVGDDFEDRILEALDKANELLVYFTPWSLLRPYVWTEIGAAWGKRLPITGVLHGITPEELSTKSGIPLMIKQRNLMQRTANFCKHGFHFTRLVFWGNRDNASRYLLSGRVGVSFS